MCTAIIGVGPDGTVLLAGGGDEFVQRAWHPPGHHWADRPGQPGQPALSGLIGGRDERAGGTWLAREPAVPPVACILNGRGRAAPAPPPPRGPRGARPLRAAAGDPIVTAEPTSPTDPTDPSGLAAFDPFRLLVA